jgi:hypothetical protein
MSTDLNSRRIRVIMAAMALDDSVEPRIASRVDRRACEKLATDASVVDEKWKVAAAKNDAEVTVVCKVANCIDCQHELSTKAQERPTLRSRSDSASILPCSSPLRIATSLPALVKIPSMTARPNSNPVSVVARAPSKATPPKNVPTRKPSDVD